MGERIEESFPACKCFVFVFVFFSFLFLKVAISQGSVLLVGYINFCLMPNCLEVWQVPRSQVAGKEGDYIPNATLSPPE